MPLATLRQPDTWTPTRRLAEMLLDQSVEFVYVYLESTRNNINRGLVLRPYLEGTGESNFDHPSWRITKMFH